MKFRKDLNGLRAIAVIGVVVFHLMRDLLPGGFSGVDVFFVISGFLMTSIILGGIERGNFRITDFYLARARRIVPALTVLCLVLILAGFFFLHPFDYKSLGKHVSASLTFLSNFVYLGESGYFDEASEEKWLLHTWSLSVEWQFYMLYPIALTLLAKVFTVRQIRTLLMVATLAGLAGSVYLTAQNAAAAFFLLPARAWELLAGGLVYLYPIQISERSKRGMESIGALLIVGAYLSLSESDAWPGYLALVPVLGAVLVIASHRDHSFLTGNHVSQWIGTASYSIYLWHWPLVVLLNYLDWSTKPGYIVAAICLSLLLGGLSYHFVEKQRFRIRNGAGLLTGADARLGVAYASVIIASVAAYGASGFDSRLDDRYREITSNQVMPGRHNKYCYYTFTKDKSLTVSDEGLRCILGDSSKPVSTLLFGDSFAGHYEPFWDAIGKEEGIAINAVTTNWCFPSMEDGFYGPSAHLGFQQCLLNRDYLRNSVEDYKTVILAGSWRGVMDAGKMPEVLSAISEISRRVPLVIIMPSPVQYDTNVHKRFERDLFYGKTFNLDHYGTIKDKQTIVAHELLKKEADKHSNVLFLQREQIFPVSGTYLKSGVSVPFSLDGKHITLEASLELARLFQNSDFYEQELRKQLLTHLGANHEPDITLNR